MSKCLELSLALPAPPQIPPIFAGGSLGLSISFGTVGVTCCHYKLPAFTPTIPLPMIGPLQAAIQALNAAIAAALPILDTIQIPNCPI